MKKQILLLFLFLLAGIVTAQFMGAQFLKTYGFLNQYHMQSFATNQMDWMQLFWNILWERGKILLLLLLLNLTPLQKILSPILKLLISYTFGLFLWACLMNMGIKGGLIAFASIFPQVIPYFFAIVLLFRSMKQRVTDKISTKVLQGVIIFLLLLCGCLLESTAGAWILQQILKKLYISQ